MKKLLLDLYLEILMQVEIQPNLNRNQKNLKLSFNQPLHQFQPFQPL